ncbi:Uncharacterised protein [Mycobacteroides abscessus subsp. massiliense]|nr:Uncharacterised protein [Mycobacteroides abscessus subsp. massiliense]
MTIGHNLLHHGCYIQFLRLLGMEIPCVAIMAIQAAHQTTLQKEHVAQARTIDSTARFNRMNNAFAVIVSVAKVF